MITASDRAVWDAWLAANHETEQEVWLVYFKKASGKPSIAWSDAVEVALRYGWIDGLIRSVDEERYMQRWTPRRPKSKWSKVNRDIAQRLIDSGEMTPMGLAAVDAAKRNGEWEKAYTVPPPPQFPDDLKALIKASAAAKDHLQGVSYSRRGRWIAWLAGTEGRTRTRRLNMIVRALESRDYAAVDAAAKRQA